MGVAKTLVARQFQISYPFKISIPPEKLRQIFLTLIVKLGRPNNF